MRGVVLTPGALQADKALRQAMSAFEARNTPAGVAATKWLKGQAADSHPSVVTRLVMTDDGKIAGFVAVTPGEVELNGKHRQKLGLIHPVQGATLIPWLAKDTA